jgi:hypothetical protein
MPYTKLSLSLFLSLLPIVWAAAADGRDFAGFCKLGEISDLGEEVSVPLTVRIHNYSDADVVAAEIILEDSLLPGEDLARFATVVDILDRESARASDTVTVPRREYEQWQQGASPQLRLQFTDSAGTTQRQPVELAPMLVDEEEE